MKHTEKADDATAQRPPEATEALPVEAAGAEQPAAAAPAAHHKRLARVPHVVKPHGEKHHGDKQHKEKPVAEKPQIVVPMVEATPKRHPRSGMSTKMMPAANVAGADGATVVMGAVGAAGAAGKAGAAGVAGKANNSSEGTTGKKKGWAAWTKKKRILVQSLIVAGSLLLVSATAVAIVGWQYLKGIDNKIALDNNTVNQLNQVLVAPESPDDPYYVLLIGSDSRDDSDMGAGRSDTIILARVDPSKPGASLISIPRDTRIDLEGYGTQKINAAFAYGGPAGAVKVVSELFDVDIAHYIEIDFNGLTRIVDKVGGIDVKVPVDIELWGTYIPEGEQHLDGRLALVMSRCRNFPNGDFQRVEDQRIVLQAIAKAVLSSSKADLPGLVTEMAGSLKTDVNSTAAIELLLKLQGMDTKNSLYMATVPSHSMGLGGVSYVEIEWDRFVVLIEKMKNGLPLEGDTLPTGVKATGKSALRALAAGFYPVFEDTYDSGASTWTGDDGWVSSGGDWTTTVTPDPTPTPEPEKPPVIITPDDGGDTGGGDTDGGDTGGGDTGGGDTGGGDTGGGDTGGGDTGGGATPPGSGG